MMMKIGGLARALYVILAIVAGFIALTMMNVPLVLVVLGLLAGLAIPRDRLVMVMVAVIALPMIVLRGSQPPVKALLLRDYAANLALLIGLIAVVTAASYVVRVARDSYHRSRLPGMEKGGRR